MATARKFRTFLSLGSVGAVATLVLSSPSIRTPILHFFHPRTHTWRFLLLAISILLNAKSLPLVWHYRIFRAMIRQLYLQPNRLPTDALFRPMITKSMYSPLNECDYYLHKSNSTYFADLDIARTQLVSALLRKGIRESKSAINGEHLVALGGVTCHFKREIKPYERFEIWTRILSWDRKWIYIMSHIVKEGVILPTSWALQPDRANVRSTTAAPMSAEAMRKAIFATSIAKYVVKKGRLTIHPEEVFQNSDLMPSRPEEGINGHSQAEADDPAKWTWEHIEAERLRGLELAKHFDALDGLHDEFPSSQFGNPRNTENVQVEVLGEFRDLLW